MQKHFLYPLFRKLRPAQAQLEGQAALEPFIEFFLIAYLLPFALISLIWLVLVSDWSIARDNLLPFLLLTLVLYLMRRSQFSIPVELDDNSRLTLNGTLADVALWAGIFIWGPTILWCSVLVSTIRRIEFSWQRRRFRQDAFWQPIAYYLQDVAGALLSELIAITVYQVFGGQFPLAGIGLTDLLLPIAIIFIDVFLSSLLVLPVLLQINNLILPGQTSVKTILGLLVNISLVSLPTTPFALVFALLYIRGSTGIFAYGLLGIVLINLLAYYLSQTNLRSQQRTREMTWIEALGEEILQAPPDGSTLPDLLNSSLERMFTDGQDLIEIRIFKEIDLPGFMGVEAPLHITRPPQKSPIPDLLWDDLRQSKDPHLVIKNVILPGMTDVYGDAVIDKITSAAPHPDDEEPPTIGGIYLLRRKTVARTLDSLPAMQALGSQIASAIYRAQVHTETLAAQKMSQELEFAGRIQASFLPEEVPAVDGWEIAAALVPARQTAGDFYDFIPLNEGKLGIVVADVADKGTGAALYMALSRTLIRTYAMQFPTAPEEVLRQANERILADTRANQFVTVFYGVLDTLSGELTYANGGHNPVFHLHQTETENHAAYIRTGPPLGIFGDLVWERGSAQLMADDVLLLYTDGVTEAQNSAREFYKDARLLEMGKAQCCGTAAEIHAAILSDVDAFVGEADQFDDITLIVLKREEYRNGKSHP